MVRRIPVVKEHPKRELERFAVQQRRIESLLELPDERLLQRNEAVSGWSAGDISYYLESGFTPDFDTVGGTMVAVQENMAKLSKADRDAIAAYLKAIPAVE